MVPIVPQMASIEFAPRVADSQLSIECPDPAAAGEEHADSPSHSDSSGESGDTSDASDTAVMSGGRRRA